MTWQGEEFQIHLTHGMVREVRYYLATLADRHDNYLQTVSGGKSVKKAITKVAQGTLKTERKVWYTELSDKGKQAQHECNMNIFYEEF